MYHVHGPDTITQYYYNGLIRIVTPPGSQAIMIHIYPVKCYKSKCAHLLSSSVQFGSISYKLILDHHISALVSLASFSVSVTWGLVSLQISSKPIVQFWPIYTINQLQDYASFEF